MKQSHVEIKETQIGVLNNTGETLKPIAFLGEDEVLGHYQGHGVFPILHLSLIEVEDK